MQDALSRNLSENARRLREARGLSQQQIARLADLPRPTWAGLESGSANPTLSVLARAAGALQVSIEELIGPPRSACQLFPAEATPAKKRGSALMRPLLPESIPGLTIARMELPASGVMHGTAHTAGTREYLTCETGHIELAVAGEVHGLGPGDALVFRGDQRHTYRNPGRSRAVAISVVAFAPT